MAKTVVVLGGSLGGLAVAHRLLKHMLPREPDLRVVLVSKVRRERERAPSAKPDAYTQPMTLGGRARARTGVADVLVSSLTAE